MLEKQPPIILMSLSFPGGNHFVTLHIKKFNVIQMHCVLLFANYYWVLLALRWAEKSRAIFIPNTWNAFIGQQAHSLWLSHYYMWQINQSALIIQLGSSVKEVCLLKTNGLTNNFILHKGVKAYADAKSRC